MKIPTTICALLFPALLFSALTFAQANDPAGGDGAITAVTGESWLHHLNRSFDETSMGKTSQLGPPDPAIEPSEPPLRRPMLSASATKTETLRGSDLYRLNCQGCHGDRGLGVPPEIRSLIDPVRATSFALVTRRLKKVGMSLSSRETAELVNQSRGMLLKRLHEGGEDMPSFRHLSAAEINSLMAYLNQLAGVPGAEKRQVAIEESNARVGELMVKSTCHICHGATGANPTPAQMLEGAVPPLSALPVRANQAQLVRKVTRGAPVVMDTAASVYRGRMPVFSYLSEDEAADVYAYLTQYPPAESAGLDSAMQADRADPSNSATGGSGARAMVASRSELPVARKQGVSDAFPAVSTAVLPASMGLFTAALLALGCWITLREFRRLSARSPAGRASRRVGRASAPRSHSVRRVELRMDSSRRFNASTATPSPATEERKIS
jgi:mono/diheme cytochrome c family protein